MAKVHPEDRHRPAIEKVDGPQDRTVAAHAHHQVQAVDKGLGLQGRVVRTAHCVALFGEPPGQLCGLGDRLGTIFVDDQADPGHQGAPTRPAPGDPVTSAAGSNPGCVPPRTTWTRYSRLPFAPEIGDSIPSMMAAPWEQTDW